MLVSGEGEMGERRRVGNCNFFGKKPIRLFKCFTLCACVTKIKKKSLKKVHKRSSLVAPWVKGSGVVTPVALVTAVMRV